MNVSVIVPTYNGAQKLPAILKALDAQDHKYFEVIVVIDGSTDDTMDVLKSTKHELQLTIISQKNKGRAAVRNTGAAAAKGDLLIFFDDDMRPLSNCISQHINFHKRHENAIVTGGLKEEILPGCSDFFRYKSFLSEKWLIPHLKEGELPLSKETPFLTAANFSIKQKTFEELGGFDESLNDAEDYDLGIRAQLKGIDLYIYYSAFAWHDDAITCRSYIKRLRQYRLAHKSLSREKSELYKGKSLDPVNPVGLKRQLFLVFTTNHWIKLVDNNSLSKFLPRRLRYKLYDLITTANGVYFPEKVKL